MRNHKSTKPNFIVNNKRKLNVALVFFILILTINNCIHTQNKEIQDDPVLFEGFRDPPAEARPFVRWWWNGNHLKKEEINRQLDVLLQAGIGGVEINPIAMPEEADNIGIQPLTWLSKEWNDMLLFATSEAQKRGMIADLIVGSGWPFGGEFLEEHETIQRVIVHQIPCSGGEVLNDNLSGLYNKAVAALSRNYKAAKSHELVFIRLVPAGIRSTAEIIDLTDTFKTQGRLNLRVPDGNYNLVYGILQRSNREVMHGAPGAAGPVMNHYRKEITRAYLDRLNKISEDTGMPLSELIRALFCDSIELDGANWTDGLEKIFFETYHYPLDPWFPFIFYNPYTGYNEENYDAGFSEQLKRVRYDYNKLLVETFLDNFTQEFQDFCTEKGVLCRYQAYGTPFLMGMTEGNMIADIPESNNWIYSANMNTPEWTWSQGHGYMTWHHYAAAGGHLTGKKIISNEAMTNTRGVFKASLEEIKQHDDMNFIAGMNHSVLHGYNYSPPEAGFPGWIRYDAYFNEKNTWWPWFNRWTDYNARLSYVFQQSQPVKNIAILAPEADLWSDHGLTRNQFHTLPWYGHRLWESISQAGNSCDYLSQNIISDAEIRDGKLTYGPMSYQAIFLCSVKSMQPETALALLEFVKNGGQVVTIDEVPHRSVAYQHASRNDSIVQTVFEKLRTDYADRFHLAQSPDKETDLLPWTKQVLEKTGIPADVVLDTPNRILYQIRKKADDRDIYFFVNSSREEPVTIKAEFPTGKKTPWLWNPEEGTRSVFPYKDKKNELLIELDPLQSMLLVFEPHLEGTPEPAPKKPVYTNPTEITGTWEVVFEHMNGQQFSKSFDKLTELGTSPLPELNTFAGTVTYATTFTKKKEARWLKLENTNKGVTEVILNGKHVGMNWYGPATFNISEALKNGENRLEIKLTTVLNNYAMSLKDNPTAERWTKGFEKIPAGLEGEILLYTE
ncbi:MAG: glycosyl hydrolase [Mariniphaga sp.]|nr:glycosyl hydrolase [Mariniphaga sp.]